MFLYVRLIRSWDESTIERNQGPGLRILFLSAFFPSPAADSAGVLDAHYILRELCRQHEVTLLSFATAEDRKHIPGLQAMCREVVALDPPAQPRSGRYFLYTGLSFASKLPAIAR